MDSEPRDKQDITVRLKRYGGFAPAAMAHSFEAKSTELSTEDASELAKLVSELENEVEAVKTSAVEKKRRTQRAIPDEFAYEIEIEQGERVKNLSVEDSSMTHSYDQLIQWMGNRSEK